MMYDVGLVEAVLPYLWDADRYYGLGADLTPDSDMPKGSADPSRGGTWMAHLIDVGLAFERAPMSRTERQQLLLAYGLGWKQADVALATHVSQSTAARSLKRALQCMTDYLNERETR